MSPSEVDSSSMGKKSGKGMTFWLSWIAVLVSMFLSALDLTAISTALPTITQDLNGGDEFVWVGSSYALSSTAILPLSGALADTFGRKSIMLFSITFFAIGSALAGAAQNMNMLIAARTIQGIGGGGIISLSQIITSDLVPLSERGAFQGMISLCWSVASGIGPPLGGLLAQKATWRWLFYLNIPLTSIAFALVFFCLKVRTPEGSVREKLSRIDWVGNVIIIIGTTLTLVGLTLGGVRYPWQSTAVLYPLIVGLCLMGFFIYFEAKFVQVPTIPLDVMSNRTSFSGYLATFVVSTGSITIIYYLPVYFQACYGAHPLRSAVDILPIALLMAPFGIIGGVTVQVTKMYRPINAVGWIFVIVAFGLFSMLRADSPVGMWVGFQVVASVGIGTLYPVTVFPVLAPLQVSRSAAAMAFFSYTRAFGQAWGISISSTILQNELKKTLPPAFTSQFPQGIEIAYAAIPTIGTLQEPLRSQVRQAFAMSMTTVWKTMIGISGLGFLTVFLMREIPMNQNKDDTYGLVDDKHRATVLPLSTISSSESQALHQETDHL